METFRNVPSETTHQGTRKVVGNLENQKSDVSRIRIEGASNAVIPDPVRLNSVYLSVTCPKHFIQLGTFTFYGVHKYLRARPSVPTPLAGYRCLF